MNINLKVVVQLIILNLIILTSYANNSNVQSGQVYEQFIDSQKIGPVDFQYTQSLQQKIVTMNQRLYFGDGENLSIYSLENLENFAVIQTFQFSSNILDILKSEHGNKIFIRLEDQQQLLIFDTSDPDNIVQANNTINIGIQNIEFIAFSQETSNFFVTENINDNEQYNVYILSYNQSQGNVQEIASMNTIYKFKPILQGSLLICLDTTSISNHKIYVYNQILQENTFQEKIMEYTTNIILTPIQHVYISQENSMMLVMSKQDVQVVDYFDKNNMQIVSELNFISNFSQGSVDYSQEIINGQLPYFLFFAQQVPAWGLIDLSDFSNIKVSFQQQIFGLSLVLPITGTDYILLGNFDSSSFQKIAFQCKKPETPYIKKQGNVQLLDFIGNIFINQSGTMLIGTHDFRQYSSTIIDLSIPDQPQVLDQKLTATENGMGKTFSKGYFTHNDDYFFAISSSFLAPGTTLIIIDMSQQDEFVEINLEATLLGDAIDILFIKNETICVIVTSREIVFVNTEDKSNVFVIEITEEQVISSEQKYYFGFIMKNDQYLVLYKQETGQEISRMEIYDISDLTNIQYVTTFEEQYQNLPDGESELIFYEKNHQYSEKQGLLYVLSGYSFYIIDFNDLNNISISNNYFSDEISNTQNVTSKSILLQKDNQKLYVGYFFANIISVFDLNNPSQIVHLQDYSTQINAMNLVMSKFQNYIYYRDITQVHTIEILTENALYIDVDEHKIGTENQILMYPMKVFDSLTFKCQIPRNTQYDIISLDQYDQQQDMSILENNLPYFYEYYFEDSRIIIKPQQKNDIGKQFLHMKVSYQIPSDLFVGIEMPDNSIIDEDLSDNIIYDLISVNYLDINRFLNNQFNPSEKIYTKDFKSIESIIRGKLSSYIDDFYSDISIIKSLELQNNDQDKLNISTTSSQQISIQLTLQNINGFKFMNTVSYPNIITGYSQNDRSMLMTGLLEDINVALELVKITNQSNSESDISDGEMPSIKIEINDGLNEKITQFIHNIENVININQNPTLTMNSLQQQYDLQISSAQVDLELSFGPVLDQFQDLDNDNLSYIVEYKVSKMERRRNLYEVVDMPLEQIPPEEFEWQALEDKWLTFNKNTFLFKGIPISLYIDTYFHVRVAASDGYKTSNFDEFEIDLFDEPPELLQSIQSQFGKTEVVIQGQFDFQIQAVDDDSPTLFYSLTLIERNDLLEPIQDIWLTIDKTGRISGTVPVSVLSDTYKIKVQVSDGYKAIADTFEFTVKDTIWNRFVTVLEILAIVISLLGLIKYRDDIYNVIFKPYYRFPYDTIEVGKMYKKQIPLIHEVEVDSQQIYTAFKKESFNFAKTKKMKIKNWYEVYTKGEQLDKRQYIENFKKVYLAYFEKKFQGCQIIDITEEEMKQLTHSMENLETILNIKKSRKSVQTITCSNAFNLTQYDEASEKQKQSNDIHRSYKSQFFQGFKQALAERIIKQKKKSYLEAKQLIQNHTFNPYTITYTDYQIIRDLTSNDISQVIFEQFQKQITANNKYKSKSGWIQYYFDQEGQFKLNDQFEIDFEVVYEQVIEKKQYKNKNKNDKSKEQIEEVVKLIFIAHSHGILQKSNFIVSIIRNLLVPSRGLCVYTSYTNLKEIKSIKFNEDSFIVKHCRSLALFLNLQQSSFPTPNDMPLWLHQDIDLTNNMIILYGTPQEEDIDNEYLLRAVDVQGYFVRQFVVKVQHSSKKPVDKEKDLNFIDNIKENIKKVSARTGNRNLEDEVQNSISSSRQFVTEPRQSRKRDLESNIVSADITSNQFQQIDIVIQDEANKINKNQQGDFSNVQFKLNNTNNNDSQMKSNEFLTGSSNRQKQRSEHENQDDIIRVQEETEQTQESAQSYEISGNDNAPYPTDVREFQTSQMPQSPNMTAQQKLI